MSVALDQREFENGESLDKTHSRMGLEPAVEYNHAREWDKVVSYNTAMIVPHTRTTRVCVPTVEMHKHRRCCR